MIDHLKLLSVIFSVIIGTGVLIDTFQMYRRYQYPFLKYLTFHIALTNLGLLLLFIVKYIDLNIATALRAPTDGFLNVLAYLFGIAIIACFGLISSKIVLNLLERDLSPKLERRILLGLAIYLAGYFIKYLLPENGILSEIHYFIYENISGLFLLLELFALIYLVIKAGKIDDRNRSKIARWFAYLFLARYMWILLVIPIPQPFRILLFGIGLNLAPLIWIRYFFLDYATGLMQIAGDELAIAGIVNSYQISNREQEIIRLILDGKSNQAIADELYVSLKTVKNHVYNIYQKMGLKSRYELIRVMTNQSKP